MGGHLAEDGVLNEQCETCSRVKNEAHHLWCGVTTYCVHARARCAVCALLLALIIVFMSVEGNIRSSTAVVPQGERPRWRQTADSIGGYTIFKSHANGRGHAKREVETSSKDVIETSKMAQIIDDLYYDDGDAA